MNRCTSTFIDLCRCVCMHGCTFVFFVCIGFFCLLRLVGRGSWRVTISENAGSLVEDKNNVMSRHVMSCHCHVTSCHVIIS